MFFIQQESNKNVTKDTFIYYCMLEILYKRIYNCMSSKECEKMLELDDIKYELKSLEKRLHELGESL